MRTRNPVKPILVLDVDGVLSSLGEDRDSRKLRIEWSPGQFLSFWPNAHTAAFMKLAWDLFDVRWCTAWGISANGIARHYGLGERPVIRYVTSKGEGAARHLSDWTGPVAWVEDGLDDVTKLLVAQKGWTYFHCDPAVGVTEEHLKAISEFGGR